MSRNPRALSRILRGRSDSITISWRGSSDGILHSQLGKRHSYDEEFNTPLTTTTTSRWSGILSGGCARRICRSEDHGRPVPPISLNPAIYVRVTRDDRTTDARRALPTVTAPSRPTFRTVVPVPRMQLTLNRRFSRGFTINSNYTLSDQGQLRRRADSVFMPPDPAWSWGRSMRCAGIGS